jgi:hypothetical protein
VATIRIATFGGIFSFRIRRFADNIRCSGAFLPLNVS